MNYLINMTDFNKIDCYLKKAKEIKPKEFKSNTQNMLNLIENYVRRPLVELDEQLRLELLETYQKVIKKTQND